MPAHRVVRSCGHMPDRAGRASTPGRPCPLRLRSIGRMPALYSVTHAAPYRVSPGEVRHAFRVGWLRAVSTRSRHIVNLAGRVAIVTGAGRGIGRAHALALASAGASVVVNDLGGAVSGLTRPDSSVAAGVAQEIRATGGDVVADHHDIASFAGGQSAVQTALDAYGRIDIVVNNAGISAITMLDELDEPTFRRFLDVHLVGTVGVTKAALAAMRARGEGGRIINTTSGAGLANQAPGLTGYASAKAGVASFTKVAALEAASDGITVNAIAPLAYTRMSAAYLGDDAADSHDPAFIARVVLWLASDLASDVTGQVFRVTPEEIGRWETTHVSGPAPAGGPGDWSSRIGDFDAHMRRLLRGTASGDLR